jgi:small subunit ribosomal protein S21
MSTNILITPNGAAAFDEANLQDGLRRLKRSMARSGLFREIRIRSAYMKPGEKAREKSARARRKVRKAEIRQAAHELETPETKWSPNRSPMRHLPRHAE